MKTSVLQLSATAAFGLWARYPARWRCWPIQRNPPCPRCDSETNAILEGGRKSVADRQRACIGVLHSPKRRPAHGVSANGWPESQHVARVKAVPAVRSPLLSSSRGYRLSGRQRCCTARPLAPDQGWSRSMNHPSPLRMYSKRSCRRLGRPCQNSMRSGITR